MNLRPFNDSARYHVIGLTEKGPVDTAVLMSTGTQYTATFGERTTASAAVYDDIALYLAEGGSEFYVTRVPNLSTATIRAALAKVGDTTRGAAVAAPGLTASAVGAALIDHAEQFGKVVLLAGGRDTTVAELAPTVQTLSARPGSENAGVFWPWLTTRDRRHIPPTGYVAAARSRSHLRYGYWKHPDGPNSRARTIHRLRFPNTPARNEEISEQLISPIVTDREGVIMHGWWSLAGDRANLPYLDTMDMLNNLAADLGQAYRAVTHHAWDTVPRLRSQIAAITKGRLASLANAGAFNAKINPDGTTADPGYLFTVTEPLTQPPDRNVIIVRVAVRPYTHANLISVRVFRVPIMEPFPQGAAA